MFDIIEKRCIILKLIITSNMSKNAVFSKAELTEALHKMLLIRRFEERASQLYGTGAIGGFCHLYIGQEAVAVGVNDCLKSNDQVITSYRCHGQMLVAGSDPKSVMAELMGKETGCSKGKGGSMHMFDLERGFYGGHGIVGAQVPIGTGMAFANKYKNNEAVSIVYFGDGAANQGQIYESFNMAALWKLPAIYIVENNKYAMGTSVERSCSTPEIYRRGTAFGIPSVQIDGMDYLKVREEMQKLVKKVRSGEGPIFVEMLTYRYRGHSMSDPAKYRSKEEVNEFKDHKDPIMNLKNYMVKNKFIAEDEFKAMDQQIRAELKEVVDYCNASSEPAEAELFTDVYND